ncbi:amino acid permease, putative [Ixodes scapularis]|uniref:Amino acid permease, putative n=1 Tax=Ixodes scapularis TaxID=6945 RepID=B7QME9_IXOSC|nr:amino acid permease, putative [Ixodes scapularis]|eukprot:XP_002416354.1 amino acid permease, putative [Ixodes scapularis]
MAFVIGWNLILEYVIGEAAVVKNKWKCATRKAHTLSSETGIAGTASVARGYSGYMDSLLNHTIETHFREWMPLGVSWLSTYPDVFALAITLFLAGEGRASWTFRRLVSIWKYMVVLKDGDNRRRTGHHRALLQFSFCPCLQRLPCLNQFVRLKITAQPSVVGEEVRNPRRAIPIGIVVSLTIVFLAYFGVSVIETLVWPYWDQNVSAPLPYVFDRAGWPVAKWVVSIGALAGLSTSLLGGMFPLPRVLYAMGSDGLIFRFLAIVHPRLKTPLLATLLSGVFAGTMAMIFNVEELANMMSIGTLLAYSLVAVSVLMLRYVYEVPSQSHGETGTLDNDAMDLKPRSSFTTMFNSDGLQSPTMETSYLVKILTLVLGVLFCTMNGILVFAERPFFNGDLPVVIPFAGVALLAVLCIIVISRQPSASTESLSFAVPFVPYIPMFNMFVNLYLMMRLPPSTWIRFIVWMVLGFLVYFGYGIFNSSQRKPSPPFLRDAVSVDSVLSSDNQSDGVAGGTE